MFAGMHPDRVIKLVYLDAIFDSDAPKLFKQMPPEITGTDRPSALPLSESLPIWPTNLRLCRNRDVRRWTSF